MKLQIKFHFFTGRDKKDDDDDDDATYFKLLSNRPPFWDYVLKLLICFENVGELQERVLYQRILPGIKIVIQWILIQQSQVN